MEYEGVEVSIKHTPQKLVAAIDIRGKRGSVVVGDLARYYSLLEYGMKSLDGLFTDSELHLLADMTSSASFDANYIEYLSITIEDAVEDYRRRHGKDLASIVGKIRSLDRVALYALVDSIERFWTRVGRDEDTTPLDIARTSDIAGTLVPYTRYDDYCSQ